MIDKTRMFTTRELPWMRLGTVIDDPHVTSAEAIKLAGLDFEVALDPIERVQVTTGEGGQVVARHTIPDRFAVTRRDTGVTLDVVSQVYALVQNRQAFDFIDGISPKIVAAGELRGGRQAFMVVQHPTLTTLDLNLAGQSDPHDLYALLRTSHDRSRGLEVAHMPLRGQCMNMIPLQSMTNDAPLRWSVRHVGDPMRKLAAAKTVMHRLEAYAESYARSTKLLVETDLLIDDARNVLDAVIRDTPTATEVRERIIETWRTSDRVGFQGTGWGLTNAVSEYYQWGRESSSRTPQSRFIDVVDGETQRNVGRTARLLLLRRSGR